jgi:hypothetical protein
VFPIVEDEHVSLVQTSMVSAPHPVPQHTPSFSSALVHRRFPWETQNAFAVAQPCPLVAPS